MGHEILNEPLPEDYRGMFDRDFIGFWDLGGKDRTLEIAQIKMGKLSSRENPKKERKPLIWFVGADGELTKKGWIVNKTNGATIAGMYGPKPADWIGKRVTLFATTCSVGGRTVECIRVRPKIPLEAVKGKGA